MWRAEWTTRPRTVVLRSLGHGRRVDDTYVHRSHEVAELEVFGYRAAGCLSVEDECLHGA